MSTTKISIKKDDSPTREAIKEVLEASRQSISFDEDSPKFTKDEMRRMADAAREKKINNKKPVVALRITPDTLELAKATGKGYTGFLSRLLDLAINDEDMVKKALL